MNIIDEIKKAKPGDKFGLNWNKKNGPDVCSFKKYVNETDTYIFEVPGRFGTFNLPLGEDNMNIWIYEL